MTTGRAVSPDHMVPEDPLAFIVRCIRGAGSSGRIM